MQEQGGYENIIIAFHIAIFQKAGANWWTKGRMYLKNWIIEEAIGEFMDLLTDRQRQVIHQIYFQQRTQREVSRVFGITEPAVSKCISGQSRK